VTKVPEMRPHSTTDAMFTESYLAEIRALIEQRSAILFDDSRERFFSGHVQGYVEEKGLPGLGELLERIRGSRVAYEELLERLLTQETSFFRYPAVFSALEHRVLVEAHERKRWQNPRTLRIWSAGCSTGEEAYSIAITLCETLKFAESWNVDILATDISRRALAHAERGIYSRRSLLNLSPHQLDTYFRPEKHSFQAKPRIQRMITFAQMNLAEAAYVGKVDCIFCMNVLMYFSSARRLEILRDFYEALEPGGYFLLGHSETLSNVPVSFEAIVHGDCRIYRKPALVEARPEMAAAGERK
jgi:chemotaxis protein methyltransferase CheR